MPGNLTLETLTEMAATGEIDTVLVALVDMQGRLMGKRFHVQNFLDHSVEETHCCNYLLATDLVMSTPDGYKATSWEAGYGDYVMRPDLSTLRHVPWLEGTAMVICDILDHHHHAPVPHYPRAILAAQEARLVEMGFTSAMATELEFFLFEKDYRTNQKEGYRALVPFNGHNEDYNLFQTTKEESIMRPLRNHLVGAGVPVENTKGEAELGQQELNIRYAGAMDCADNHTIAKHATKEIAWANGVSATFLPKWKAGMVGSASHVHMSLWKGGEASFYDADAPHGLSELGRQFSAGLLKYAPDIMVFLAPYVNSYKRFAPGTFAPTKTVWSVDNRTAGFRLCGEGTKGVRMECRIGGSDMNPYLAQAALLAAGIAGINEKLELSDPVSGDVYADDGAQEVPRTLRDAMETLKASDMLRAAFGDDVVDHYYRAAEWEQEEFDRAVTDWEIERGFERA
ncbi:glutamine synthetase family protein [Vannielia litorea]|uniref:glutamine synthetase family protein n=1 Tax=Vannielia litorea TaxID=1217970 RepID=UPI001C9873DB|nr:glutamine synthetase family protein [Vannielia litorea]MBY6046368.1 glutamine synthetase family protein [Vannielia litorea]MBY6073781.1 glutamine synthetase family protein [Vannielia litorea]